jgi:hypothetical protein
MPGCRDDHIAPATRMPKGSGWVFARKEASGAIDAAYAAAGAVLLALTP